MIPSSVLRLSSHYFTTFPDDHTVANLRGSQIVRAHLHSFYHLTFRTPTVCEGAHTVR